MACMPGRWIIGSGTFGRSTYLVNFFNVYIIEGSILDALDEQTYVAFQGMRHRVTIVYSV